MKLIIVLSVIVTATLALPVDEFEAFKLQFGKLYENGEVEQYHKNNFIKNKAYIEAHNADTSHGYTLGINEFADLDLASLTKQRNGYQGSLTKGNNSTARYFEATGQAVPASVDWRSEGYVTKVKNQGNCGSCWAFSTTGSLEGQHFKKTGKLVSLSEQQLVDCSKDGNKGCKGGLMITAFKYIKENGGDDTEESYRYKGENGKCKFNKADVGATCTGYVQIKTKDCAALKEAIATIGPISIGMDASLTSFQLYNSGIYKPRGCSSKKLDHGVLAVGYGTENGEDYWLIKNSWGRSWGMEGYFKIAVKEGTKDDICGICTAASYPTV